MSLGEQGKRKKGVGIVIRNLKIENFTKNIKIYRFFLKNSNFSKNLDLLPWIQESLESSKLEEIW